MQPSSRIIVITLLCTIGLGCAKKPRYLNPEVSLLTPAPAQRTPVHSHTDNDDEVLQTVLADLQADPDDPVHLGQNGAHSPLLFSMVPLHDDYWPPFVLSIRDADSWEALTSEEQHSARVAATHLRDRQINKVLFERFEPMDRRVRVWEDLPASTQPYYIFGDRPISAYSPGYSANGEHAVVCIFFPWSIHAGHGLFVLGRVNARWVIRLKQFVYYL